MLKALIFDIETSPLVAYAWNRRDVNIALNQIKKDFSILSFAAKWLGDAPSKVIYRDNRKAISPTDDRALLAAIWKLLDEAEVVITQNGKKFDSRKLNARFIMHGMQPPSPYKHIDTYRIASNVADFTSGSLEYLSEKLCTKYKKLTHKRFPGMSLWDQCLANNVKAWDEMKRYNVHDVLATEELYTKLRAWAPKNTPDVHAVGCGACGGALERRGTVTTRRAIFVRRHCTKCGAWSQGSKLAAVKP